MTAKIQNKQIKIPWNNVWLRGWSKLTRYILHLEAFVKESYVYLRPLNITKKIICPNFDIFIPSAVLQIIYIAVS